jgi:hypothetical protein
VGTARTAADPSTDPFRGNMPSFSISTVRYAPIATHPEGNSLGDWAPIAAGSRPAISTVTVEVPQWPRGSTQLNNIITTDAAVLLNVFLEDPGAISSSAATTPSWTASPSSCSSATPGQ